MAELDIVNLKKVFEQCCVHRLSKNFSEKEDHVEFNIRKINLDKNILALRECLRKMDTTHANNADINSSLLTIYKELLTEGDWNPKNSKHYASLLNSDFEKLHDISLEGLLKSEGAINTQQVYDLCLDKLHNKLTTEDFKRFPSLIQVYGLLLQDVKDYKVKINPLKTLPVSLLLIDDYETPNRIVGLKCCIAVLNTLTNSNFSNGNYHDVIYKSLSKSIKDKDLEVTKLTMECLLKFLKLLYSDAWETKTDDAFSTVLEETQMETNFYRKVRLINAISELISIYGVNCVSRKKKFNAVIIENIDLCVNDSIRDVLLDAVLRCMETWIKHCWCTWKLTSDKKLLTALFKLLCAFGEDEKVKKVQDLIVALISLCEEDERSEIISGLKVSHIKNERFSSRLEIVLKNVLNKFK